MNVTKETIIREFPELRGSLGAMNYPAFAEIKIDGEANYIEFNKVLNDIRTINKYGTTRRNFYELDSLKKVLNCNSCVLLCELYFDRGKLHDIYKLNSNKKSDNIHLYIFDVVELNNKNMSCCSLLERKEVLYDLTSSYQAKCNLVNTKEEVMSIFENVTMEGYEGIVVKSLLGTFNTGPCSWVKMKYKDRTDYKVSLIDHTKERIEVLVPYRKGYPPEMMTDYVKVGVKAPNRYKKYIKLGDNVTIEHQGVLDSGSLRHPVLIPRKDWK